MDVKGIAASAAYLPGLAPREGEIETPSHPPNSNRCSGLWVRRSAKQVTNADGQPTGFCHHLMRGRKVIRSGIGADCARMFQQQAVFLNQQDVRPQ